MEAAEYGGGALSWLRTCAWYSGGLVAVLALLILLVPIGMRESTAPYIYTSIEGAPEVETALVLGASVIRGEPSPILEARTDSAIELYKAGKAGKILVTGDNGALNHDEVTPVRKYLIDAGVAAEDIFLDHAGFDTYSSMYRARSVFGVTSVIVVTQDFHLPRAVFIARALGLPAYGFPAREERGTFYNYLREVPASVKAARDLLMRRVPEYLGPAIPISGDGSTTWY
ncbi:MAG: ElyC/SanA/YdcF family protein [bacterium]